MFIQINLLDDETALKEFQKYLGTEELEFKNIKMRVGIHKRLWVKNVVCYRFICWFY
jgi:hypothetical protein